MNALPFYIPAVFAATTFLTIYLFYRASGKRAMVLILISSWMLLLTVVALTGFFTVNTTIPPRFFLVLLIPIITIISLFSTSRGVHFIEGFDIGKLTLLHSIRVAVELALFWLFLHKTLPQLMTIEGRNFDLLSGITAPFVWYFGFVRRTIANRVLLTWNIICLLILLFTVGNAVLSAPTPLQRFGFGQPTVAVLYFPFVWLPGVVVPIVIFSHLIAIRTLLKPSSHLSTVSFPTAS